MAGYSETPLHAKLGIKEGMTVDLLNAPPEVVTELPNGVVVKRQAGGSADVVVAFFTRRADFERRLGALGKMVFPSGGLWIAWPKQAAGVRTDMTGDGVREVALPLGLVDNKVCAIDETWSGLRMVWRRERRSVRAADSGRRRRVCPIVDNRSGPRGTRPSPGVQSADVVEPVNGRCGYWAGGGPPRSPAPLPGPPWRPGPPGSPMATDVAATVFAVSVPKAATVPPTVTLARVGEDTPRSR